LAADIPTLSTVAAKTTAAPALARIPAKRVRTFASDRLAFANPHSLPISAEFLGGTIKQQCALRSDPNLRRRAFHQWLTFVTGATEQDLFALGMEAKHVGLSAPRPAERSNASTGA
jgi:hypothetical protein